MERWTHCEFQRHHGEGREGKCEGRIEKCEFLARESVSSSPIVQIFGKGKCKFIANFSATMVTSLPSFSLSLCISLSLSHQKYLTHNIGSASALPMISSLKKINTAFQQIFKGGSYKIFAASYENITQWSHLLFFWSWSDAKATQTLQKGFGIKAGPPPPWFEFLAIFDFLHPDIEEVQRHLLWKFYKKIGRKSWSNVPPKLLACIGFLYKVVHKIGRLRKFNRSREIEINFLTAWTISMIFGTLVQHAPGYKTLPQIF